MRARDLRIGRILHEDAEMMTLEVYKNEHRELELQTGDRFITMVFVRKDADTNTLEAFTPWAP